MILATEMWIWLMLLFYQKQHWPVLQTTKGVTGATAEVQSVAGFTESDISALSGKTLFFHDGTNSLSVEFTSTPADLDAVVSCYNFSNWL
jgi:hypothetical protein